ncbi:leucine-rich repeat-containing protein 43 [Struthio camelus]|uniref:leucine-rich repeat-containing protein 43 n=1 Tax=Struthio camelus TaxID=8801 RepID=UPI003603EE66
MAGSGGRSVSAAFREHLRHLGLRAFPCSVGGRGEPAAAGDRPAQGRPAGQRLRQQRGPRGSGAGRSPRREGSAGCSAGVGARATAGPLGGLPPQKPSRGGAAARGRPGPEDEESREARMELLSGQRSPWALPPGCGPEDQRLRQRAVQAPGLLRDSYVFLFFRVLRLVDKGVDRVDEGLLRFQRLEELVLSANRIGTVASANLPGTLKVLELCGNAVGDLRELCARPPPELQHLGLGYNRLRGSWHAAYLAADFWPNLVSLDLSFNALTDLRGLVSELSGLQKLRVLALQGNPLALVPAYRGFVVDSLPRLFVLDDAHVGPDEKHRYRGLAGRPELIAGGARLAVSIGEVKGVPQPGAAERLEAAAAPPLVAYSYYVTYAFGASEAGGDPRVTDVPRSAAAAPRDADGGRPARDMAGSEGREPATTEEPEPGTGNGDLGTNPPLQGPGGRFTAPPGTCWHGHVPGSLRRSRALLRPRGPHAQSPRRGKRPEGRNKVILTVARYCWIAAFIAVWPGIAIVFVSHGQPYSARLGGLLAYPEPILQPNLSVRRDNPSLLGPCRDSGRRGRSSETFSCPRAAKVYATPGKPWADPIDCSYRREHAALDLVGLKAYLEAGTTISVVEEKVLSWPLVADPGEAALKKGTAGRGLQPGAKGTVPGDKLKKKKEKPRELRSDPPIQRILGTGRVSLEALLAAEDLVATVCDLGIPTAAEPPRPPSPEEKDRRRGKDKSKKPKEERESEASQTSASAKGKGKTKEPAEAAEGRGVPPAPLTVRFQMELLRWPAAAEAEQRAPGEAL